MKFVLYSLVSLVAAAAVLSVVPVFAQESAPMTDDHIARIKSNCQGALSTLARIHANDAPVYINNNQTYFSISDKMMARLNSRLTLNRFDASDMVKTASDFNDALDRFRSAYKSYDDTMSDVLRMDCQKQPVSFYDKVGEARNERQKVNDAITDLKNLIDQYRNDVKTFQDENQSGLRVGHNG